MYEHSVPILFDMQRMTVRINPLNMYDTFSANSYCELVRCNYVFTNKRKTRIVFVCVVYCTLSINTADKFVHNEHRSVHCLEKIT